MTFEQLKIKLINLGFRKTWYFKTYRSLYTLYVDDKFSIDVSLIEDMNYAVLSLDYINDVDFYSDQYNINDSNDVDYDDLDKLYNAIIKRTSKFFRKDKLNKILEQ